jgi:hypothetical protein
MIKFCATAAAAMLVLTACGADAPDDPQVTQAPDAQYRDRLLADAYAALAAIPPNDVERVAARIHLARALAPHGAAQDVTKLLADAAPEIQSWPEGFGTSYKTLALARISAAQAALGIRDAPVEPADVIARLGTVEDPESRAVAQIEAGRDFAAAGIDDAALALLREATRSIESVPSLARRSFLYREALGVYERLDAKAQMREALAAVESSAWLEEDASRQPVALMRLAEVYAHLQMDDEAEAIKAALPANYYPAIDAAKAVALAADGHVDDAVDDAMAIDYAQARADALIGILQQPGAKTRAEPLVAKAFQALAASTDETTRVVQYYALASALLPGDPEHAAQSLQLALDINRQSGKFWNFDAFAAADLALARAGALKQARELADQIDDADRRRRQADALTAVAAREAAKRGNWQSAHDLAMSSTDAAARTIALAGVLDELK